jgi:hypothetical protein
MTSIGLAEIIKDISTEVNLNGWRIYQEFQGFMFTFSDLEPVCKGTNFVFSSSQPENECYEFFHDHEYSTR